MSKRRDVILLIITAALWSTSGLFVKIIEWSPLAIISGRGVFALAVTLLYLRYTQAKGRGSTFSKGEPASLWQWNRYEIFAGLGLVFAQLMFISGTKITDAANVIFLAYTAPVYVVLFGYWFLNERPQRADWITMPVIFGGMFLFFADDLGAGDVRGNIFGILSGIGLAVMTLCMRRQKDAEPARAMIVAHLVSLLVGLPALVQSPFSWQSVVIVFALGTFQIGVAFVLYSIAIKTIPALEATLITTLEPMLNPLLVFFVLGEVPGRMALLGGLLVVGAVIGRAVASARAQPLQAAT